MSKKIEHQTPPGFRRNVDKKGRVTYAPNAFVRSIHAEFYKRVEAYPLSFGDPLADVRRHIELGGRFFFKTDLFSAFDQVTFERIQTSLRVRGVDPQWFSPRKYFFHEEGSGGLIQGAPPSPWIFGNYCRHGGLEWDLYTYCEGQGFHYSQYVDDILISSPRRFGRRVGPSIRRIVGKYGFTLSDAKTKTIDVHTEPLEVLGYVIRGTRVDPNPSTLQSLHDLNLTNEARTGIFRWRKHVRKIGKPRFVMHR